LLPGARLAIEDRTCAVMRPSISAALALASSGAGATGAGVASVDAGASSGAGGDDGVVVAADWEPRRLSCLGLGTFVSLLDAEFAASGGFDA
jgi:hypothetical protein